MNLDNLPFNKRENKNVSYIKSENLIINEMYIDEQNDKYIYLGNHDCYGIDENVEKGMIKSKNLGKRFYFLKISDLPFAGPYKEIIFLKNANNTMIKKINAEYTEEELKTYKKALMLEPHINRYSLKDFLLVDLDEEYIDAVLDNEEGYGKYCINIEVSYNDSIKDNNSDNYLHTCRYLELELKSRSFYYDSDKDCITTSENGPFDDEDAEDLRDYLNHKKPKVVERYFENGFYDRLILFETTDRHRKIINEICDAIEDENATKLLEIIEKGDIHFKKDFALRYAWKLGKKTFYKYLIKEYQEKDYDILGSLSGVYGESIDSLKKYIIENC